MQSLYRRKWWQFWKPRKLPGKRCLYCGHILPSINQADDLCAACAFKFRKEALMTAPLADRHGMIRLIGKEMLANGIESITVDGVTVTVKKAK